MPTQPLQIKAIVQETADTKSFVLHPGEALPYKAGQFLTLLHPLSPSVRRSYSLSSHPVVDAALTITVKRIPNGEFSRWLFDNAKTGDTLQTIGASGLFTLPDSLPDDAVLFFLAAGSGITPVFSLLKEVLFLRKQKVVLVYSNHSEQDTIFYSKLTALQKQFPERLTIYFLQSDNQNLLRARLNKSLLSELVNQHITNKHNALVYLCGPHDYMQMARIVLLNENISAENIRTEKFTTNLPVSKEAPPDTHSHQVFINYHGKIHSLTVKYPDTILQAARRKEIDLPYSCEAGRCGTCAATCLSGQVWMSRNEVLLDKEVASGRILICTGYPVGGDVQLKIND